MLYKTSNTEKTEEKFREVAMRRYGYAKGALSKAAEEAFQRWLAFTIEPEFEDDPVKAIDSILADIKMDSVALQHTVKRLSWEASKLKELQATKA